MIHNAKHLFSIPLIMGLLLGQAPSYAHHSVAEYDESTTVEIQGEIKSLFWRNPHVGIQVTTRENGVEQVWQLEAHSVSTLRRRGITAEQLSAGTSVRVAGAPSTERANHMAADNILLPDGTELLVRRKMAQHWPGQTLVGNQIQLEGTAESASAEGLFRVWTYDPTRSRVWFFDGPEGYPLTASAQGSVGEWGERGHNPVIDCIAPGMPSIMGNPYPMEIAKVGDNIEIRLEEFDVVRRVHLIDAAASPSQAPSTQGYSIGYWEGETLVVETTQISWPYFNRTGISQSNNVRVIERFSLSGNDDLLDYQLVVTDPVTLTEPFSWNGGWKWQPGEQINRYDCAIESF